MECALVNTKQTKSNASYLFEPEETEDVEFSVLFEQRPVGVIGMYGVVTVLVDLQTGVE